MTKFFATCTVALTICVAVQCLTESSDAGEADPLPIEKDDNEVSEGDDTDMSLRMAHAKAYASIRTQGPGLITRPAIRFVNCLSCVDCPKALYNTTTKYCPYTNDPTKNNKCVVYAEKYIQMKKLWYVRGCASERGSCADIKRGHDSSASVKLTFCSECEGDRCNTNGVSRSTFDLSMGLLVLILCPIIGKYTFS